MSLLTILEYPDPRLRIQAKPISQEELTPALQQQIDAMLTTMYAAPGIGLAGTQVDFHRQLIVMDISDNKMQPQVLINPQYTPVGTSKELMHEGCLSVPEYSTDIERYIKIHVKALDRQGQALDFECEGLLAQCIQHECDHLKGIVFVDYISRLKRERVKKKLLRLQR